MKKFIYTLSLIVALFVATSVQAVTVVTVLPANTATNILGPQYIGQAQITQIMLSTVATNAGITVYDSPTNVFSFTNASYTAITSYPTNYINTYTNFYGVINSTTNLSLVDVTTTFPATTNAYPARFAGSTVLGTTTFTVNTKFNNGAYATNTSGNAVTVTTTFNTP